MKNLSSGTRDRKLCFMKKRTKGILAIVALSSVVLSVTSALALNSHDIVRLKRAGVSEALIEEIIISGAIGRALISVDEIVEMKQVRIGDEVILELIKQGSITAPELDRQDLVDRTLMRAIEREKIKLDFQEKELGLLVKYISRLITNPEIIRLVHEGKIASEDYAEIVKCLKQYARGEETIEYDYNGNIDIDIHGTHKKD